MDSQASESAIISYFVKYSFHSLGGSVLSSGLQNAAKPLG